MALKAGTSVLSPSPVCSAAYSVSRPSSQSYLLLNSTSLPHPRSINATFSAHADTNTPRPSLGGPISLLQNSTAQFSLVFLVRLESLSCLLETTKHFLG